MPFEPRGQTKRSWSGYVCILAPGEIPTVDYYLTPRLTCLSAEQVWRFDSRAEPSSALELPQGTFVVIVRHACRGWLRFLLRQKQHLSGVAYLMDDDIPAAWRCGDVPLDYRIWTSVRFWSVRDLLSRVCDRVWVSTPTLQSRYPQARLLPPLPYQVTRSPAPPGTRRWGYHGTRIHLRELRWLVPVVAAVQQAVPEAEFEVFGDRATARRFGGIPRVTVLPPLTWPDYLRHSHDSRLAVGLAPKLPGRFNAARSHTKIFDITRCGAVGVFSARASYMSLLADAGVLLLSDDPAVWVREIIHLLKDDDLRLNRYRRMDEWLECVTVENCLEDLINEGK